VPGAVNQLSVASYNILNFDIDPTDGDDDVSEGRLDEIAFDIGIALGNPDIVALQEVQDDSGSADNGTMSALMTLEAIADAVFAGSRAPLGANFAFNGGTVTVINNHFTSKGGSDRTVSANQLRGNGGALTRAAQAAAVNGLVDTLLMASANANIVVTGDLNEFQFEEPLEVLTGALDFDGSTVSPGSGPVLENLTFQLAPEGRFSFLFEGSAQALDHMLVSSNNASDTRFDAVRQHRSRCRHDHGFRPRRQHRMPLLSRRFSCLRWPLPRSSRAMSLVR
jgi:predicted extracellular nuclease